MEEKIFTHSDWRKKENVESIYQEKVRYSSGFVGVYVGEILILIVLNLYKGFSYHFKLSFFVAIILAPFLFYFLVGLAQRWWYKKTNRIERAPDGDDLNHLFMLWIFMTAIVIGANQIFMWFIPLVTDSGAF